MRTGNKSTLRGTVQSVAGKYAGAGRRTWRHVFGTDRMEKLQIAHRDTGVFNLCGVRRRSYSDGGARGRGPEFKSSSVLLVHPLHGYFLGQIGIHEDHVT